MKIQEAANKILEEFGRPLSPEEISKIALDRGWVSSRSKDPVFSLKTTIMKNIRDGVYNKPQLIFINTPKGRLIGLPHWEEKPVSQSQGFINTTNYIEMKARIPVELFEKIQLASQAKIAKNQDEVVIKLLTEGVSALTSEIKKRLLEQLNQLDT